MSQVQQHVQECSVEEVHWLMTKEFRGWLAQSYSECDEVCDALEAEQHRLKRIYLVKEQVTCAVASCAISSLSFRFSHCRIGRSSMLG